MLLVIFGLRGFKHELESQIALRCAKECYGKLLALDNVNEVSAGVTTGEYKTFLYSVCRLCYKLAYIGN